MLHCFDVIFLMTKHDHAIFQVFVPVCWSRGWCSNEVKGNIHFSRCPHCSPADPRLLHLPFCSSWEAESQTRGSGSSTRLHWESHNSNFMLISAVKPAVQCKRVYSAYAGWESVIIRVKWPLLSFIKSTFRRKCGIYWQAW